MVALPLSGIITYMYVLIQVFLIALTKPIVYVYLRSFFYSFIKHWIDISCATVADYVLSTCAFVVSYSRTCSLNWLVHTEHNVSFNMFSRFENSRPILYIYIELRHRHDEAALAWTCCLFAASSLCKSRILCDTFHYLLNNKKRDNTQPGLSANNSTGERAKPNY